MELNKASPCWTEYIFNPSFLVNQGPFSFFFFFKSHIHLFLPSCRSGTQVCLLLVPYYSPFVRETALFCIVTYYWHRTLWKDNTINVPLSLSLFNNVKLNQCSICRAKAGVEDSFITHGCYDDTITLQLVQAASEISGEFNNDLVLPRLFLLTLVFVIFPSSSFFYFFFYYFCNCV